MSSVKNVAVMLLILAGSATSAIACGGYGSPYDTLFADDPAVREMVIARMRKEGPQALDKLFELRGDLELVATRATDAAQRAVAQWSLRRLDRVIDSVGGQRHCTISRLYWHTDLGAAKAAAQQSGKPILSLRMLGNLTDEYSCANSRFFRTTLYANETISRTLRENFVLHWQSVRPVPVVTIDFGDGRTLKRTLTGNSAHFVLAADGRPLDVLPGLYHPQAFLAWLKSTSQLAGDYAAAEPAQRDALLTNYHAQRQRQLLADWRSDLEKIGAAARPEVVQVEAQNAGPPKAQAAALVAVTKSRIETPILNLLVEQAAGLDSGELEQATGEDQWAKIAMLRRYQVDLDDTSVALIRSQLPPDAGDASQLIRALEDSIGLDTLRNEYRLHRSVHQWFASGEAQSDVEQLNKRVYAELFLTPSSDPWLGLAASDVYTALDQGGVATAP